MATPYRPTGLSTAARGLVRLVDELIWLNVISTASTEQIAAGVVSPTSCRVKVACAAVLERGADLLDHQELSPTPLHDAVKALRSSLSALERDATIDLPVHGVRINEDQQVDEFISSLDPSFRAQELSFAVSQIAANIDFTVAEERRSWVDRLLGRQPAGLANTFAAAQERAGAHVERHSVWLHNSVRSAAGLGLAVLVANLTGVQHSFWVVLGTLSVLRSNALNTGQNALRSVAGTVAGFIVGALILMPIGSHAGILWALLPIAILIAGVAPAAISFTAGQAAFTLVLVILFNIVAPSGWRVGLIRVEDIALGCSVSFLVGTIFWPRGASAALGRALAEAYADSARYLDAAVMFGIKKCDRSARTATPPREAALQAASASRRLDDTFRTYLTERGTKPVPLAEMSSLVTSVAGIRLAADAVIDLWDRDDGRSGGDRAAARTELINISRQVHTWYQEFAGDLVETHEPPQPLTHDKRADGRLIDAVRHDLREVDGSASATAVRMIWTGDHLDAARRLQTTLIEPAQAAVRQRAFQPLRFALRLPRGTNPIAAGSQSSGIGQSSQQT